MSSISSPTHQYYDEPNLDGSEKCFPDHSPSHRFPVPDFVGRSLSARDPRTHALCHGYTTCYAATREPLRGDGVREVRGAGQAGGVSLGRAWRMATLDAWGRRAVTVSSRGDTLTVSGPCGRPCGRGARIPPPGPQCFPAERSLVRSASVKQPQRKHKQHSSVATTPAT